MEKEEKIINDLFCQFTDLLYLCSRFSKKQWMKNDKMKQQYRINEQIRVREVRIVGDNGSTVLPTRDALNMAREQGVDLVEISPNANPPVCRLIDYSKFLYQQKKRAKEMKA